MKGIAYSIILCFYIFTSFAFAFESYNLNLIFSQKNFDLEKNEVPPFEVKFFRDSLFLLVFFDVKSFEIISPHPLPSGTYPYQFDVAEIFLTANPTEDFDSKNQEVSPQVKSYFEYELGPYNDSLQVRIDVKDGKKKFNEGVSLELEHRTCLTKSGWKAWFKIPLSYLKLKNPNSAIYGNAFSVLGKSKERNFYSLFSPVQTKPNFHQPELFKKIEQTTNYIESTQIEGCIKYYGF